jgi:hypothetical protein
MERSILPAAMGTVTPRARIASTDSPLVIKRKFSGVGNVFGKAAEKMTMRRTVRITRPYVGIARRSRCRTNINPVP